MERHLPKEGGSACPPSLSLAGKFLWNWSRQTPRLAVLRSGARVMIGPRGKRPRDWCRRCPGALPAQIFDSGSDRRKIIGGAGAGGVLAAQLVHARSDRHKIVCGARAGHVSSGSCGQAWLCQSTIIQREAHQPQRRAVSVCGIGKSCAQGRSYLNVSPDRLLS